MKFRLLEAEIMTYQGHRQQLIELLNSSGVSYPVAGDLAIKRNLLCGLADLRLGNADRSDRELEEARRLSDASTSKLNGEVLRAEAVVALYRNHFSEAADLARKSLNIARTQHDQFLEVGNL